MIVLLSTVSGLAIIYFAGSVAYEAMKRRIVEEICREHIDHIVEETALDLIERLPYFNGERTTATLSPEYYTERREIWRSRLRAAKVH
jgi:hypothetical protein